MAQKKDMKEIFQKQLEKIAYTETKMIRLIIRIKKLNQTWSYIPLSFSKNFNSLKKKGQMLQSLEFMTLYKSVPLLIYSSSQIFWYCF